MIECQICKRMFGALSGKHLKNHNITAEQYREQFPGHQTREEKLVSAETRARMSASRTGKKHSPEAKAKIGAKHRGKVIPKESVDRQRESYQKFLESNGGSPQKGYKRSDEFKKRMSHIAQTRDPALVQQKVEQMWAARRGSKATDEQKARYSEARLDFIEKNPDKIIPKLFNTKPEQELEQILVTKNIAYSKNKRVGNRLFDFVVEDCVIEIDGPLMHGNKTMTLEERTLLLREMQTRDALKTQLAKENGYRVFRLDVTSCLPKDWYERLKAQGWDIF